MTKKPDSKLNPLHLNQQLCFAMYSSTRMIIQAYDDFLQKLDITYLQFLVLSALWQKDKASVKELGRILLLDSGTLSPLLKKLQHKGLVKKSRDKKDERVVYIELTPAAEAMQKEALKIPPQMLCKLNLKKKEVVDLRKQLQTLAQILKKGPKPVEHKS